MSDPSTTAQPDAGGSAAGRPSVCVVGGAGHVGLPLALRFAERGHAVVVHDIDPDAIAVIEGGTVPFTEAGAEALLADALKSGLLTFSTDPASVAGVDAVVITIGTPVDEFLNPVHAVVQGCIDALVPHLRAGQLVVLRSTVYPGTTDWLGRYLAENAVDVDLAFCPERVVQGKAVEELVTVPQIVSGVSERARDRAAALFDGMVVSTVPMRPMEAEFAKLFSNAYRYIHFAITNQFYMIADEAGCDYHRILEGMKRDYPRNAYIPGPGLSAGPCLFKDTMQLAAFARNTFSLGHDAMLVNEGLVLYIIQRLDADHGLADKTVGILGMAFKPNVDDTRSSLSYKLKKHLTLSARAVLTTDPHVHTDPALHPLDHVIEHSDVLILAVPHAAYDGIDTRGKPVFDVWRFLPESGA